jgi:release factor glutamine methyltransferase
MTDMIKKRSSGYPLQYILGEWEFYGLPFIVGEGVLIPRPDTETLVDKVLEYAGKHENLKIADLCSGSGCIATAIEKNTVNSDVYAVEISDIAYKYLEKNIELNSSSVKPYKADVLRYETAEKFRDFDVIVSNPPYLTEDDMKHLQKEVSYEPEMALYGNSDGLEFYRRIPEIWYNSLKHGGMMAFEVGMGQAQDVAEILKENGFKDIKAVNDLSGIARAVYGRKF